MSSRQAAGGKVPCRFRTAERQPVRCIFSFRVAFFIELTRVFCDFSSKKQPDLLIPCVQVAFIPFYYVFTILWVNPILLQPRNGLLSRPSLSEPTRTDVSAGCISNLNFFPCKPAVDAAAKQGVQNGKQRFGKLER